MEREEVPTYGLLIIIHAYNVGKITFKELLELSGAWAHAMIEQHAEGAALPPPAPMPSEIPAATV